MARPARNSIAGLMLATAAVVGCGREHEMPDSVEMPAAADVHRAMQDDAHRDALLDTMPGGEMARGDSLAEMKLLEEKM